MSRTVFDKPGAKIRIDDISAEPPKGMTREKAAERFASLGTELFALQDAMFGSKVHSVVVVLQGRDGAGKDGTIKHVVGNLNPRGVNVISFGVPTTEEREHDFLWRVHRHAPRRGEFSIFNRSHYEDVLVVRVHDLVPKALWKERYGHIIDFEELLAEHGTIVLNISCISPTRSRRSGSSSARRTRRPRGSSTPTTGRSATTGTITRAPTRRPSPGPRLPMRRGPSSRRTPSGIETW